MKTLTKRQRIIAGLGVAALIAGALWLSIHVANNNARSANEMVQTVLTGATDKEVCSHVSPGQYLMAPGGDWKTPAVAAVASGASPLVRDAYFAAASIPFPESSNWSETFPPYERAMSQLATVCAGVRARP